MKYAICNELYDDWPHAKAFEHAASLGYRGVEIAPFTLGEAPTQATESELQEVRDAAERAGLEILGLHWLLAKTVGYHLTTADAEVRRNTAAYLGELAQLCRDLGGSLMVLGSPQQRNLQPGVTPALATDHAAQVLTELAPTLERCEVTLALEPLGPQEGNFLLTANEAVALAQRVDSPAIRLHLDVKAMSSEALPIDENIRQHAPWLAHFHANDPNLRGPGMGRVDYHPIFQALSDVQYQGWVSVEVFDYEPGIDVLAQESIEYMQRIETELQST